MNLFAVQMYNLVFKVDDDPIQTVMLLWYEDCLDKVKGANAVPDSPDIGDFLWLCIVYDVLLNDYAIGYEAFPVTRDVKIQIYRKTSKSPN